MGTAAPEIKLWNTGFELRSMPRAHRWIAQCLRAISAPYPVYGRSAVSEAELNPRP